jgi:hypothetical protein
MIIIKTYKSVAQFIPHRQTWEYKTEYHESSRQDKLSAWLVHTTEFARVYDLEGIFVLSKELSSSREDKIQDRFQDFHALFSGKFKDHTLENL